MKDFKFIPNVKTLFVDQLDDVSQGIILHYLSDEIDEFDCIEWQIEKNSYKIPVHASDIIDEDIMGFCLEHGLMQKDYEKFLLKIDM